MEKKLDGNYTKMLWVILNKSWRQQPTKQQLYGHPPPIMKTIKIRQTRHAGHCWRSRNELIRDALLWTPSHRRAKTGWPAQTNIQQLCADMGCSLEDLPEAMDDREGGKRESGISVLMAWHDDNKNFPFDMEMAPFCLELMRSYNGYKINNSFLIPEQIEILYPEPLQIDSPEKEKKKKSNDTEIDKNEQSTNLPYPTRERKKNKTDFLVENLKVCATYCYSTQTEPKIIGKL